MQFFKRSLDWMPSSLSRNVIVMLAAVLSAIPWAYGQSAPQRVSPSAMPVSVATPVIQAQAGDISARTGVPAFPPPAATGVETGASPSSTEAAVAELPRDLTPLGMFVSADMIVKAVMLGLAFASVLTWTIWLAKTFELVTARRCLNRGQRALAAAHSLAEAFKPARLASPHVALLIQAVEGELHRSPDLRDVAGIKERIMARFERIEAGVGRQMMRATGILATIGATAPFVGLFGTVWGIMNSFIGISKLHTTNLAVVAPGIAEALLATAFGLAAAIPAVVIYNAFARSIANYRALYANACAEILTLVSRDLSQPHSVDDRRVRAAAPAGTR